MASSSIRSIVVGPTPFNIYTESKANEPDIYNRRAALSGINSTIRDNGLTESLEFIYTIVGMSDILLFENVERGIVKSKDDFDKNYHIILDYVRSRDLFSPKNILLKEGYFQIKQEERLLKSGASGVRGIAVCPRCRKDNIIIYSKQKSKGDEGETQFNTCQDCNHKWYIN